MKKLVTIKNKRTGAVNRFSVAAFDRLKSEGFESVKNWHKVPKKMWKRQQKQLICKK